MKARHHTALAKAIVSEIKGKRRAKIMNYHSINKVLDIGANVGQYGLELRLNRYWDPIISFEPLRSAFQRLSNIAESDGNWIASHIALGDKDEDMLMNISANSVSSSLLPMLPRHINSAPDSGFVSQEMVHMRRLDSVASGYVKPHDRILLKIDTQGYEEFVLAGTGWVLNNVQLIECELSLFPLYSGHKLFSEMIDIIHERGFDLVDLCRSFEEEGTGYCLQMDGIFARHEVANDQRALSTDTSSPRLDGEEST